MPPAMLEHGHGTVRLRVARRRDDVGQVIRMGEVDRTLPFDVMGFIAQDVSNGRRNEGRNPVAIKARDHVGRFLHDQPVGRFGFLKLKQGLDFCRDLACYTQKRNAFPVPIALHLAMGLEDALGSAGNPRACAEMKRTTGSLGAGQGTSDFIPVIGMDPFHEISRRRFRRCRVKGQQREKAG
jgi:hypothetical protein